MKNTKLQKDDQLGQFVSYNDSIDYTPIVDKTHPMTPQAINANTQVDLADAIAPHIMPPEVMPMLEEYIAEQTKLSTLEFINKFLGKMSQNLHGFCLLRALGYDVMLEHNGKHVSSLRQLSEHFKVSHQYIHKLTKDYGEQIGLGVPKSTSVQPPDGYATLANIMKKYSITRHKLKRIIQQTGATVMPYKRNSKIVQESLINNYIEKKIKESI
jgi:hypothetical protein